PANGSYKTGQNLDFTVTFSENATVVTTGGTPAIGLTIGATPRNASYVSGSGTGALLFRYTIVSADSDSDGIAVASSITLNGGTIKDAVSNNAGLGLSALNTTGVLIDNAAPTVTINQAAGQSDPSNNSAINFTVVFSESVAGFTAATDVTTSGTATFGTKTVTITGSGTTYNVAIGGMNASGTVIAAVPAGAATDAAGNGNTASTSTDATVTYDITAPASAVTVPANTMAVNALASISGTASD